MSYDFIKLLAQKGVRIFTVEQARSLALQTQINPDTMSDRLHDLKERGMVESLMKGLYCLSPELLKGIPIHEYEIALALVPESTIAYLSAYSFHKLTDQLSSIIYVMTPLNPGKTFSKNLYRIKGIRYRIIRVKKDHYFGIESNYISQEMIKVTNLERTLIDGLVKPKYCGGFREVLDAYEQSINQINVERIISYAERISTATCKRLGYVLSHLSVSENQLKPLLRRKTSSFSKLDPSGINKGPWNKKWMLQENL